MQNLIVDPEVPEQNLAQAYHCICCHNNITKHFQFTAEVTNYCTYITRSHLHTIHMCTVPYISRVSCRK